MERKSATEIAALVAQLFAKADDPAATPEESQAFLAKATELMVRYEIDEFTLDAGKNGEVPIIFGQFRMYAKDDRLVPDERMVLTGAIARNFECRIVVHTINFPSVDDGGQALKPGTYCEIIGYKPDVEMVMALYFTVSMDMLSSILLKMADVQKRSKTKIKVAELTNYQREFAKEYTSIIDGRLRKMYGRVREWTIADGVSDSVAVAIQSRLERVQAKFNEKYPPGSLGNVKIRSTRYDHNARAAGRAAALKADIGGNSKLGGKGGYGEVGGPRPEIGRG